MVSFDAFGGAEAFPSVDVAHVGVVVTLACCREQRKVKNVLKPLTGESPDTAVSGVTDKLFIYGHLVQIQSGSIAHHRMQWCLQDTVIRFSWQELAYLAFCLFIDWLQWGQIKMFQCFTWSGPSTITLHTFAMEWVIREMSKNFWIVHFSGQTQDTLTANAPSVF